MEQETTYVANIDKLPLLQYLKNPVLLVGDLYTKYPFNQGWFVWVEEKKTFYYWDKDVNDWLQLSKTFSLCSVLINRLCVTGIFRYMIKRRTNL